MHEPQGNAFDEVLAVTKGVFSVSQLCTALSRTTSAAGLYIEGGITTNVADAAAVRFMKRVSAAWAARMDQ